MSGVAEDGGVEKGQSRGTCKYLCVPLRVAV